jgi:hypothetical protein
MEDYAIATYVDLGFWWWMAAGTTMTAAGAEFGVFSLPLAASRWIGGAAFVADVADMISSSVDIPWLPNGPVDYTYPVVYHDTLHIGKGPLRLHFTPPKGKRP